MLFSILATVVSIAVVPAGCFDPCNFRVTLRVEPAVDNTMVVLEVAAPDSDFYRRSDIEYNGQSARTREVVYMTVPAGTYKVIATLWKRDADGYVRAAATASKSVKILGDNIGLEN